VQRGQVIAASKAITPATKFRAEVYVLTKEEGGRHTPFFSGYKPPFFVRTTDVTGTVALPAGVDMCLPGDNLPMTVALDKPVALDVGSRFALREGGKTVGSGMVVEVLG